MPVQSALNLILRMKSPEDLENVAKEIDARWDDLVVAGDSIGTLHSMRWVVLGETTLGLFTVYDGDFETYAQDFLRHLGPLFDLLLAQTVDPPPMPVQKNPQEFVAWSKAHDLPSHHGLYSAYPDLSVQDIKALVAT
jgi:hypothetical protein